MKAAQITKHNRARLRQTSEETKVTLLAGTMHKGTPSEEVLPERLCLILVDKCGYDKL